MKFCHLHCHSHYSLLDGLPKIDEMLDYAKELGMEALALTDHGVLYGAVEFYKKAKERGIKPIIGCEVYEALESRFQKRANIDDKRYHLILLVKNEKGYKNLVKLVTKAQLEGFYYKPRVDKELLKEYREGLICLSGCLQGRIPKLIISGKFDKALKEAKEYLEIFGKDNFYLEVQYHPNLPEQKIANKGIFEISKKLKIPVVATNDCHYLKKEDAKAQDILMLINTNSKADDPERLTMIADDFSMRTQEEMISAFKNFPEAIENTLKISNDCNFEFMLGKIKLPSFQVPNGKTSEQYLRELCLKGFSKKKEKFKDKKQAIERLERELKVIEKAGFASYFLIVQDFVNWAKKNRIIVGPGRGSVGGSLVAYLLGITEINPLEHNLLFERFLNLERVSLPDIDLDFTDRRRDEVIEYVAKKYGRDRVAQIITFGRMTARAVVRDVGRALKLSYSFCDRIAKLIPFGSTLDEALKKVRELKDLYETDEKVKELIDFSKKLEGVARHASTHACGVVISKEPLTELVPLQHSSQNEKAIVTQYEMHSIEDLGLLKMDFLGLKNLTIIEDTLSKIYAIYKKKIEISKIPFDDKKTFKLFREGKTTGVFQLESDGMKGWLRELKPTKFDDIVAMVALYRPGPMQFIPEYVQRKHGKKPITYLHPKLEPILKETYGICIYQEQLMKIAQNLAGFTLGEADILRKAVGKKIKSLLESQKEKLIKGMIKNGIKKEIAEKIWNWILPFARYGFNRCLTGDTEILDANTGEKMTIKEIYEKKKNPVVWSLNKDLKLVKKDVVNIFYNGIKPVYKVRTRLGKEIKVTLNHPFLTIKGWEKLENLKIGDRIALARKIPLENRKLKNIKDHQLIVLGYVLAEGNLCHPHGFYFYSKNKKELNDYKRALENFKNTKAVFNKKKLSDHKKKGYLRETLAVMGKALLNSNPITLALNLAQSDIYWDEIVSIEFAGEAETYDLTIKDTHNFLANDFIVHNSHSCAYAQIAYQTAYLKAHYPVEFMASLLTSEGSDVERIAFLIEECKEMGIEVLPPDINESWRTFSVIPNKNKIRFGLLAIKNVGTNIVEAIIKERKERGHFVSFADFVSRIDSKDFNKKSLESLIKAGVFDRFEERNKLLSNLEEILNFNREIRRMKIQNQKTLFDFSKHSLPKLKLKEAKKAPLSQKLIWEKELLGLYVSAHPLENYRKILEKKTLPLKELKERMLNYKVRVGGIISSIKRIITKNGQPMLFVKLEDLTDKAEVVVFPSVLEANPTVFQENKIIFVFGKPDKRGGEAKIIAEIVEEIREKEI